ncbi:hypothetical protein GRF29_77g855737 [Pseudopithomyces chartarum]|uniref:Alpha/beta hydrolase fold-3 domain-containing protein n=1 Tax=Pseudopithomyces chartarum TaxID=1892770 RepID=A0AAN6RII7_9PLEO|nr:hypothetical protein GRF29_77g855737 [Pseudopithomyces chartarum]
MMHDRSHKHPGFIHLAQLFVRIASTAIWRLITYPLRSAKAQTLKSDVFNAAIRTFLTHITIPQTRYLLPSTTQRYLSFCDSQNHIPSSISVPYTHHSGAVKEATAHWIGDPSAAVVLLYFHGGAYFQPATSGTFLYVQNLTSALERSTRKTVAALVVAYSLAPEASFPTQIQEGVALLRYLVSSSTLSSGELARGRRKEPGDVYLAGDSAGGILRWGW